MTDEPKDVTITVRVDRSLKSKMDDRPEVNWSAVARKAIRGTVEDLAVMDEIASKNRMTEADAEEIAAQITKSANERAKDVRKAGADKNRVDGGAVLDRSGDTNTSGKTDSDE